MKMPRISRKNAGLLGIAVLVAACNATVNGGVVGAPSDAGADASSTESTDGAVVENEAAPVPMTDAEAGTPSDAGVEADAAPSSGDVGNIFAVSDSTTAADGGIRGSYRA